jgi:hypothetical protein
MANRCARHERPYIGMEKFALTNLINTNKPKERPSSLANGIRQCDAWKRRDGSCWPIAVRGGVTTCLRLGKADAPSAAHPLVNPPKLAQRGSDRIKSPAAMPALVDGPARP